MQDPGSVRVNQDHGSLASRVRSRVSVADPVPSLPQTIKTDNQQSVGDIAYHTFLRNYVGLNLR